MISFLSKVLNIDPTWGVFIAGIIGAGVIWVVTLFLKSRVFSRIDALSKQIALSDSVRIAAHKETKEAFAIEIKRIDDGMIKRDEMHKNDLNAITKLISSHTTEDERKFSHISDTLGTMSTDIGKVGQLAELIVNGQINIPKR